MDTKFWVAGFIAAALVGSGSGVMALDRPAEPVGCENNACFMSDGNCDVTDIGVACREILGGNGCESYNCQME